jgi:2,4-dienoyl-CoA reductase-like NADH-dependent reductase (Old Yellow Enzyme family)
MYLMRRIERFLQRADMAPTRFGREAIGDPRLVSDMKNGRELRDATIARIQAWLDEEERKSCP